MADFQPFNLGQVLQTAEAIKAARSQSTTDRLREQYLGEQIQGMRSDRERQQRLDDVTFGKQRASQEYTRAGYILQADDPKGLIETQFPDIQKMLTAGGADWATVTPEQLKQTAKLIQAKAGAEAGIDPGALSERQKLEMQSQIEDKRIAGQQGFQRDMQEDQQSFASGQQQRQQQFSVTQAAQERQAALEAEQRRQAFTSEQNRLEREARAAAKSPNSQQAVAERQRTLDVYTEARNGLIQALEGTETGALAGRIPAVTAAQQTGEGAVAAMAPVLKQLFRSAGEGTFTDKDQELLLRMVPTRTDEPEARRDKLANIDRIISAKLGLQVPSYKAPGTPSGASGSWGEPGQSVQMGGFTVRRVK